MNISMLLLSEYRRFFVLLFKVEVSENGQKFLKCTQSERLGPSRVGACRLNG